MSANFVSTHRYSLVVPSSLALRLSSIVSSVVLIRKFPRSGCTPQTVLQQFQDLSRSHSRNLQYRQTRHVRQNFSLILLSNVLITEAEDIQPDVVGWINLRVSGRIFMVATRRLWSVPANPALRKTLQFCTSLQRPLTNTW